MKKKTLIASLILNALIVVSTVLAVGCYFWVGPDVLGSSGSGCFKYFTTDSNVLVAVASLVLIICELPLLHNPEKGLPKWALLFKFAGTVSVNITLLIVLFFLAPVSCMKNGWQMFGFYFEGNTFALHLSTPLLAIFSLLLTENEIETGVSLRLRDTLWALAPTVVYSFVYAYMVIFDGRWTDWYGFTFGGNYAVAPISMLVMYCVTFAISAVLCAARNNKK